MGLGNVGVPLLHLAGLAAVVSLLLRFRRARGDERQQLKWFVFAAALTFASVVADIGHSGIHSPLLQVAVAVLGLLIIPSLPVAVGIAILRYRLYDIDVLVNCTLVYGALTVALALVYLGDVALFQGLLRGLTGQRSDLAVVAATLLVAVLFHPLRQRRQANISCTAMGWWKPTMRGGRCSASRGCGSSWRCSTDRNPDRRDHPHWCGRVAGEPWGRNERGGRAADRGQGSDGARRARDDPWRKDG